jgi:hypothetical protein
MQQTATEKQERLLQNSRENSDEGGIFARVLQKI